MDLSNFKTVKDKVRQLLILKPESKDNDIRLKYYFWQIELGVSLNKISASKLLELEFKGRLTDSSTILRARRQLNEKEPETRGKSYNNRKNKEIEVRNQINN